MSHQTALHRNGASAPLKWITRRWWDLKSEELVPRSVLDYGCGHGADVRYLQRVGVSAAGYDPYWSPARPDRTYDSVMVTYVLNVVPEDQQEDLLRDAERHCRPGGTVYVTVRRDLPKEGKQGRGCWQRWVECPEGYEVIRETKSLAMFRRRV